MDEGDERMELSCWEHIPMYEVDEGVEKDGIELLEAHTYG